jgi:hypothetical protein
MRFRSPVIGTVLGLCLGACGISSGIEAPATESAASTSAVDTAAAGCEKIVEAIYRRRIGCIFGPGATPLPISDLYMAECSSFGRAVAAGRVAFDASSLDACVADIDASGCNADPSWTFDPQGPCAKAIVRADAGVCETTWECGAGAFCTSENVFCSSSATCAPRPGLGAPCGEHFSCAYGLACAEAAGAITCEPPRTTPRIPSTPIGGACGGPTTRCEPAARCTDGTCVRKADVGEPCTAEQECLTNRCAAGVCARHAQSGEPCAATTDCAELLGCNEGICQATCH